MASPNFEIPSDIDPDARLLLGDPNGRTKSFLDRYWIPAGGFLAFGLGSILTNLTGRRPINAGIHKHVLLALFGGSISEYGYRRKEAFAAERDFQYLQYILLHPEDFPAKKPVLYRDYLDPWVPVR